MKGPGELIAVAVLALIFMPTPAQANPGIASHMKADVTIGTGDASCAFFDAPLSADPPNTLTIYLSLAPYRTCESTGGSIIFDNDPNVTFNDTAATAVVDRIHGSGTRLGVSCGYEATDIVLTGDVSTRDYSGSFSFIRTSGSIFVCPSTVPGSMTVDFH